MNLTNPTQIWPEFFTLRANLTRLDPNLDPEGSTQQQVLAQPRNKVFFKGTFSCILYTDD